VQTAAFGSFFNQGQIYMSTDRIIVRHAIAEEFVARLTEKTRGMRAGKPGEEKTVLAAMIDAKEEVRVRLERASFRTSLVEASSTCRITGGFSRYSVASAVFALV
jgi:acyl-CoA reductase-like NAD-dependent aldehyde dehydrogenase